MSIKIEGSDDIKICGPAKIRCCNQAENMVYVSGNFDACNCLPSCTTVSYDVDTSQAEYDLLKSWSKSKFHQIFDFQKYFYNLHKNRNHFMFSSFHLI